VSTGGASYGKADYKRCARILRDAHTDSANVGVMNERCYQPTISMRFYGKCPLNIGDKVTSPCSDGDMIWHFPGVGYVDEIRMEQTGLGYKAIYTVTVGIAPVVA